MSFKSSIILFIVFMLVGLGSYIFANQGLYPAAIVNLDIVTVKTAEENFFTSNTYYKNALLLYGNDPEVLDSPESQLEIKRATLDKLIIDIIIYNELNKIEEDFYPIANRNIKEFVNKNNNVEEGAKLLYGLDLDEFKKRVLLPQAYREILEGRMFLNNKNFNEWLKNSKANAAVFILLPDLEWTKDGVKIRD